eukprot:7378386-Prymnesium_polylepis.1
MESLEAQMPWGRPKLNFATKAEAHKQVAQLDACPETASHLYYAIAAPQPAQHETIVRHLFHAVDHAHVKKCGVRFGGDAMNVLAKGNIHSVALGSMHFDISLYLVRQRQCLADRAKACQSEQCKRGRRMRDWWAPSLQSISRGARTGSGAHLR